MQHIKLSNYKYFIATNPEMGEGIVQGRYTVQSPPVQGVQNHILLHQTN